MKYRFFSFFSRILTIYNSNALWFFELGHQFETVVKACVETTSVAQEGQGKSYGLGHQVGGNDRQRRPDNRPRDERHWDLYKWQICSSSSKHIEDSQESSRSPSRRGQNSSVEHSTNSQDHRSSTWQTQASARTYAHSSTGRIFLATRRSFQLSRRFVERKTIILWVGHKTIRKNLEFWRIFNESVEFWRIF